MAVTEDRPMFLRAINTEGDIKSKEYIFQRLLETIYFVGAENVVQVVTRNASNCRGCGADDGANVPSYILDSIRRLYFGPRVEEHIGAAWNEEDLEYEFCNLVSEVSLDAQHIRNFIMNHSMRLSMFNECC
jgi:hypothetical protein